MIGGIHKLTEINNIFAKSKPYNRSMKEDSKDFLSFLNDRELYAKDLRHELPMDLRCILREEYLIFLNYVMDIHFEKPLNLKNCYETIDQWADEEKWMEVDIGDMLHGIRVFLAWRQVQALFKDSPEVEISLNDLNSVFNDNYHLYPSY